MSHFKLTITGGDNPIELGKYVSDVKVLMNTIDNNVMNRSNGVLAQLEVAGRIDEDNTSTFLDLFRWSKDFNSKTQYRKVELFIYKGDNEDCYRHYEFGKMFVVDYNEEYYSGGSKNSSGKRRPEYGEFTLSLTQKDDNWDTVESFPS